MLLALLFAASDTATVVEPSQTLGVSATDSTSVASEQPATPTTQAKAESAVATSTILNAQPGESAQEQRGTASSERLKKVGETTQIEFLLKGEMKKITPWGELQHALAGFVTEGVSKPKYWAYLGLIAYFQLMGMYYTYLILTRQVCSHAK